MERREVKDSTAVRCVISRNVILKEDDVTINTSYKTKSSTLEKKSFEETPLFPVVVGKINVFYCSDDRWVFFFTLVSRYKRRIVKVTNTML